MNEIKHNVEYEKKLIELLGYNIIESGNLNCWLILDDHSEQVGFIKYEKLYKANRRIGIPATFGYCTTIDSSKINYNNVRKCNNSNSNSNRNDSNFHYEIGIKRKNDSANDHLEIDIGEYPTIRMWSEQYGFIDFHVCDGGFYLNFKSETENYNIEENLSYHIENRENNSSEYVYQINYCNKNLESNDDENSINAIVRQISGKYSQYYQEDNTLKLSERTWIHGKLTKNKESIVSGNVEQMAIKHQMGIDAFKHFRFLINEILPFKEDIISILLSDEKIKENGLLIFFADSQQEEKSKIKKK